jgi:hypothetical protein
MKMTHHTWQVWDAGGTSFREVYPKVEREALEAVKEACSLSLGGHGVMRILGSQTEQKDNIEVRPSLKFRNSATEAY